MREETDVLVVGGGPAGATAATLLARQGHQVRVLERDRFPRYHIGESLLPSLLPVLDALGAREVVEAHGFVRKTLVEPRMTDLVERLVPDELWLLFRRVVPPTDVIRPQGGGRRRAGDRECLAAIIFVATSGCTAPSSTNSARSVRWTGPAAPSTP